MTLAAMSFLDALKAAAARAEIAEAQYRREAAQHIAALERERAFAFRRLNLMSAVAGAIAPCKSEEIAVANALAVLRARLGWETDSDARTDVLSRFAAVAQAVFHDLSPSEDMTAAPVQEALEQFETWYADHHQMAFCALFEHYVTEAPLVDF